MAVKVWVITSVYGYGMNDHEVVEVVSSEERAKTRVAALTEIVRTKTYRHHDRPDYYYSGPHSIDAEHIP